MHIKTKRLTLVACTENMIPIMHKQFYNNGPEIERHLNALAGDPTLLQWGSWLIIRESDQAIVGDIGFKGKPNSVKQVEIGYGLLQQYCHNGYATEAVAALIKWALGMDKVDKIVAETEKENWRSMRVLEKVGMQKTNETARMVYWGVGKTATSVK